MVSRPPISSSASLYASMLFRFCRGVCFSWQQYTLPFSHIGAPPPVRCSSHPAPPAF